MTLLTICQNAADEIGINQPSSIISNANPEVAKLLRYSNKVGKRLMKEQPWQVLRKETTFSALNQETQTSILASDFDRFVPETFWNRTDQTLVTGPIGAVEWQGLKASSYDDDSNPKFAYRGGSVLVIPSPTASDTLAFEYVSNQWCQSSGGSGQTAWAADTDTGVLDEELLTYGLIYEYLLFEGLPWEMAASEYRRLYDTLVANDQPGPKIMVAGDIFGGGRHFDGVPKSDTGITNI